jgi:membrane-associated phospholipid phosphatase
MLKKLDQVRSASGRRAENANAALRTVIRKHLTIPFQGGFAVFLAIALGAVSQQFLLTPAQPTSTPLRAIWVFVTNFGDTAVTVPLAVLTCSFLGAARQVRLAFVWSFAILGCAGVIGALKLVLAARGPGLAFAGMLSPSGHTAMSTAIYGSLSLVIAHSSPPVVRPVVYSGGILLISGIGASRLALRYHTPVEVAAGLVIGVCAVAGVRIMLAKRPTITLPVGWLIGAAVILVTLLHGKRWPAEQALWDFTGLHRS